MSVHVHIDRVVLDGTGDDPASAADFANRFRTGLRDRLSGHDHATSTAVANDPMAQAIEAAAHRIGRQAALPGPPPAAPRREA